MKYRQLGQTDIKVSAIALGTWAIGGGPWWGNSDEKESINTIHAALDAGINLIDTEREFIFIGDSPNDAPMFAFFSNAVGVANVRDFENRLTISPTYVTNNKSGAGFVEMATILINAQGGL